MDRISAPNRARARGRARRAAADRRERPRAQRIGRTRRADAARRSACAWCGSRSPPPQSATVQIMAERPDGTMTIDDCERRQRRPVAAVRRRGAGQPAPIGWRFPRRASTGRWCASRISAAPSATRRGSRWRSRSTAASAFAARSRRSRRARRGSRRAAAPAAPTRTARRRASISPIADMAEARLVLTEDLIRATLRREKAAKKQAKAENRRDSEDSAEGDAKAERTTR